MIEPSRNVPHMTTHPSVVIATAEVFRKWGAIVTVGEGPGHVRDTEMALSESGIGEALDGEKLQFADLNYEETGWRKNAGKACKLAGFHFPASVVEADLIVSIPKLKTHHWMGMTAAMKNLYGTIPGCRYGWPKNVLQLQRNPLKRFSISMQACQNDHRDRRDHLHGRRWPNHGKPKANGFDLSRNKSHSGRCHSGTHHGFATRAD